MKVSLNDRDPENEPCSSKKERGYWFELCKPKSKKHQGQSPEKGAGNGISIKDKADYKKKNAAKKAGSAGCVREMWARAGTSTKECPR